MSLRLRIQTAAEYAANAATRWRSQYSDWRDHNKFADGVTKGQIDEALDSHQHTPANIAGIINPGWAYPQCDACDERFEAVAIIAHEWREETFSICRGCARRTAEALDAAPVTHQPIPNAHRTGSVILSPQPDPQP